MILKAGVLRTPDKRFLDLPGFAYPPRYLESLPGFEGLRMAYIDEGPATARHTFLCLHGQPTWSYLYRRMIPTFLGTDARVVAPDLFGFGRSDKPADESWYTFTRHRAALMSFVAALDLMRVTLVCHDWGGLLGLTLPMEMPQRFSRLIVMNTFLATGAGPLSSGFLSWRSWVARTPDLHIGALLRRGAPHLGEREAAAYDAPFPDVSYKAGVRRFPQLVCDRPDADGADVSRAAFRWWRDGWQGSSFMAIGLDDIVITPQAMHMLRETIRNCPAPMEIKGAGHFVPEWGERIARAAVTTLPD